MSAEYSVEKVRKQVELRRCFQSLEVFKGSQHTFGEVYDHPEGCFVRWEDVEKFLSTHPHSPDAADSGRADAFAPIPEAKDAPTDELWNAYNVFNDHYCGFNTQQALRYAINNVLGHRAALAAQGQSAASPAGVPDGERSDVWVVQDENGQPIHCASWPLACHEHINDAINEHGIEEAKAWKVLHYSSSATIPSAPAKHCDRGPDDCVQCSVLAGTFAVKSAAPSAPEGGEVDRD